ncbi:MAG: polysaccharide deacetylase family protein [Paludibacter sp.]
MNSITIITCIVLLIVMWIYIIPYGITILLRKRFISTISKTGCVCLTFDDGPHPDSTPEILSLLKQAGMKATFFILGKKSEQHPDIVNLIIQEGHEIGDHSYGHIHAWKNNPFRVISDLFRGKALIDKFIQPERPIFYRPPFGKLNFFSLLYIYFSKRKVAFWNVDPKDYNHKHPDIVADYVNKRLMGGCVVLFHDGREGKNKETTVTIAALKLVLKDLKTAGLHVATLSEAFNTGPLTIKSSLFDTAGLFKRS